MNNDLPNGDIHPMLIVPEPWSIENEPQNIWSNDGTLIAKVVGHPDFNAREVREIATRIAVCVNFCRELPLKAMLGMRMKQVPYNITHETAIVDWIIAQQGKIGVVITETDPEELAIAEKLTPSPVAEWEEQPE